MFSLVAIYYLMYMYIMQVKYKVEVAEWAFSVHSTHSAPHLVLLSEFLGSCPTWPTRASR